MARRGRVGLGLAWQGRARCGMVGQGEGANGTNERRKL